MMADEHESPTTSEPCDSTMRPPPYSSPPKQELSKPIIFENFRPTPNYFSKNFPNGCAQACLPLAWSPILHRSFAHSPWEHQERPQALITPPSPSPTRYKAITPTHDVNNLDVSPPKHLPPPTPARATPSVLLAIPTEPQALVTQPTKPAAVVQQPDLPPSFETVCQKLVENSGELKTNLKSFIEKSNRFDSIVSELHNLTIIIDSTFNLLLLHRSSLTTSEANLFLWAHYLHEFWTVVQPNGYALVSCYGQEMGTFLSGVAAFGRFLGLQIQDLDLTPPPPPPPAAPQIFAPAPAPAPTPVPSQTTSSEVQFVPTVQQATISHEKEPQVPMPTVQQPAITIASTPQVLVPQGQQVPTSLAPSQPLRFDTGSEAFVPQAISAPPTFSAHMRPNPLRQRSGASRNTRNGRPTLGRPSNPSPIAPPAAQLVPEVSSSKVVEMAQFNDEAHWTRSKEITDTKKPFTAYLQFVGWSDNEATRQKIWSHTIRYALLPESPTPQWSDASFVENELTKRAPDLMRATFLLAMQARMPNIGPNEEPRYVALPVLAGELINIIKTAAKMTKACGGMSHNSDRRWTDWVLACGFFHNLVYTEIGEHAPCGSLRGEYNPETWDELTHLWEDHHDKWILL
jgi:hypothetical protein